MITAIKATKVFEIFPKAPIREALLDIRTENLTHKSEKDIGSIYNIVRDYYPIQEPRRLKNVAMRYSQGQHSFNTRDSFHGFYFKAPQNDELFQARVDGFTYNKLKPYSNWSDFKIKSKTLWEHYYNITQPRRITKIALRYINAINIPLPVDDIRDYILTTPEIAPGLPGALNNFFIRLVFTDSDTEASAIVIVTLEEPVNRNRISLIFDTEVYFTVAYTSNHPEIWDKFEILRVFKNQIFFKSLTNKTMELFR